MKWRTLGRLLEAASHFQHEPERAALRDLGRELGELERTAGSRTYERAIPAPTNSR